MVHCQEFTKVSKNPLQVPVTLLTAKIKDWTKQSTARIPADLLRGTTLFIGTKSGSAWFRPKAAIYRHTYPIHDEADADARSDRKPDYNLAPDGKALQKLMSRPM